MNMLKVATQDITLTVSNIDGGKTTFPVPSGTEVDIHVAGLHYNRMLNGYIIGTCSNESRSALLERTTQVHARAVPRGLAEGCVYSIQSRSTLPIFTL